jgi:hypothetical protein
MHCVWTDSEGKTRVTYFVEGISDAKRDEALRKLGATNVQYGAPIPVDPPVASKPTVEERLTALEAKVR